MFGTHKLLTEAFEQIEKVAKMIGEVSDGVRDNALSILNNKHRIYKLESKVSNLENDARMKEGA